MDLKSESSVPESVEDNEEIKNFVVNGESSSQSNGFHDVENSGENEMLKEINEMRNGVLGSSNSHPAEMKPEASPSPTSKGFGLKKWKRIRRDVSKVREGSVETGKMESRDIPNSGGSSSKRAQVYIEKNQKSEGSFSSTNAISKNLDGFGFIDDSALPNGPLFATGTDSENSEDQSSKSTAASAPNVKHERPLAVGVRISGGKNVTHSAHRSQQGKVKTETTKKARGDRAKIEKENSYSSMESDSRSSNFVFVQGIHSPNNGIRSKLPTEYDGDIGDEVQGAERQVSDGHLGDYSKDVAGGYEDSSPDDVIADSSWNAKDEICNNHGSTLGQDPLIEPTFLLQAVQKALEKELLKFKEISKNVEQELQETSSLHVPSDESIDASWEAIQSEILEAEKRDAEKELEDLYRQKIEVEVEYLTISRKVQSFKTTAEEEQKVPISEQTKILDKNTVLEDFVSADETLKLQKTVCKYTSCFFMQLVLLVVILGIFFFQLSPDYEGEVVVPT